MVIMIFDAINHVIQSRRYAPKMLPMLIALIGLIASALACSAELIVGPQQANLTPTFVPFATATAGGRVSVWLITPTGAANAPSPTAAPFGSLIAPVASATAAFATLQAATFAAGPLSARRSFNRLNAQLRVIRCHPCVRHNSANIHKRSACIYRKVAKRPRLS